MIYDNPDGIFLDDHYYDLDPPFPPLPGASLLSRTWLTPTLMRTDAGSDCTAFVEHWVDADGRFHSDYTVSHFHDPKKCPRGYRAFWKLKDGRLFLRSMQGRFQLAVSEPVHADWFSGELRIKFRTSTSTSPDNIESVSVSVLRVAIQNGMEINRQRIDTETRTFPVQTVTRNAENET